MTATMMRPDLDAIEARVEADGPGGAYVCWVCEEPYDPEGECMFGGSGHQEPDEDDVCRDDRAALLAYVHELEAGLAALQATLGGGPGVPLDGEALDAWMLGGG